MNSILVQAIFIGTEIIEEPTNPIQYRLRPEVSHISDEEIKGLMKATVDTLYRLLWQRDCDVNGY